MFPVVSPKGKQPCFPYRRFEPIGSQSFPHPAHKKELAGLVKRITEITRIACKGDAAHTSARSHMLGELVMKMGDGSGDAA